MSAEVDLFEKLTERDVEKRLTLSEVLEHPWTKGKMYTSAEFAAEMKDRIQLYANICKKELEESKTMSKWTMAKFQMSQIEVVLPYKLGDPLVQGFMAECTEINAHLEKLKSVKTAEISQEKLSDDQVNSNSEENSDDNEELDLKAAKSPEDTKSSVQEVDKR